jgi:hypothetical protein
MGLRTRAVTLSLALAMSSAIATGACALATSGLADIYDGGHDATEGTDAPVMRGETPATEAAAPVDGTTMTMTMPDAGEGMGDDASDVMNLPEVSPPPEASTCPEVTPAMCGGTCMANCSQCAGAPLWCQANGLCVADCTTCTNLPIQCFACDDSNPPNSRGSCEPQDANAYCLGGRDFYDGTRGTGPYGTVFQHHCPCATAAGCPGMTQVCAMGPANVGCQTCGEIGSGGQPGTTGAETCKDGKQCNPASAQCQ